jgi:hypothetical protein
MSFGMARPFVARIDLRPQALTPFEEKRIMRSNPAD